MSEHLSILCKGMVTAVGLNAEASCAAIRAGITGFAETEFLDADEKPILGAKVPMENPDEAIDWLAQLAASSIREILEVTPSLKPDQTPLFLGVMEGARPGRPANLDSEILGRVQSLLGVRFQSESRVIPQGRMSGVSAIQLARSAILRSGYTHCIIAGVDSFLTKPLIEEYEKRHRLLTPRNTDGFIPGETAAAILISRAGAGDSAIDIVGMGSGTEASHLDSGLPLRADGLVTAFNTSFVDAAVSYENLDYRLTDLSGEQYFFREASLAITRTMRIQKDSFDLWHPADSIGELGASAVPCVLAVAEQAARKGYAPGPGVLCHFSSSGPERAAVILRQKA